MGHAFEGSTNFEADSTYHLDNAFQIFFSHQDESALIANAVKVRTFLDSDEGRMAKSNYLKNHTPTDIEELKDMEELEGICKKFLETHVLSDDTEIH